MNAAIAQHLNVVESAIVRIEEWANVLFVVVRGIGARFVSKKVVGNYPKTITAEIEGRKFECVRGNDKRYMTGGEFDGCSYYYEISIDGVFTIRQACNKVIQGFTGFDIQVTF